MLQRLTCKLPDLNYFSETWFDSAITLFAAEGKGQGAPENRVDRYFSIRTRKDHMPGEGITKFNLHFSPAAPLPFDQLREINAWRRILFQLRLIGREADRYGGFAYGNISRRLAPFTGPAHKRAFLITGSQTGGLAQLGGEHFAVVLECDPEGNRIVAEGPMQPSTESITHALCTRQMTPYVSSCMPTARTSGAGRGSWASR